MNRNGMLAITAVSLLSVFPSVQADSLQQSDDKFTLDLSIVDLEESGNPWIVEFGYQRRLGSGDLTKSLFVGAKLGLGIAEDEPEEGSIQESSIVNVKNSIQAFLSYELRWNEYFSNTVSLGMGRYELEAKHPGDTKSEVGVSGAYGSFSFDYHSSEDWTWSARYTNIPDLEDESVQQLGVGFSYNF